MTSGRLAPIHSNYHTRPREERARTTDDEGSPDAGHCSTSLTLAYLAVMTEVTNSISAIVAQSFEEEHPLGLPRAVKKTLEKLHLAPKRKLLPLVTTAQLARVREMALHKARELNLSPAHAERLVDAVVGRLDA